VTQPGLYRHQKSGAVYLVLFTAVSANNAGDEPSVIYLKIPEGKIYSRRQSEFEEMMPLKQGPRFVFLAQGWAVDNAKLVAYGEQLAHINGVVL
jgi:hypothetical protein